jgi:bifunctional DNA-binding transcriptional regulator/antitoxin component of YhaV-PrlF toxin-antitoxin module
VLKWYIAPMTGNVAHAVALGDRGRFVVPAAVRERHGWHAGQPLVAVDTEAGLVVMSADDALAWLRSRLEGRDLVGELLAARGREAADEQRRATDARPTESRRTGRA